MEPASTVHPQKPETGFLDRLGGRFLVKGRSGEYVEILIFRDELVSASGFEAAVRGAVARLADFRHPAVRRVRGIARLAEPDNRLALVSESVPGSRLSEILLAAEREGRPVDTRATLFIVREVIAAVHAMHEASGGVCHGALGPERVLVTPDGGVLVVEHVLGSALDCHTTATNEKFWRDYRLAVAEDHEAARFGPRTDVLQTGLLALSLVMGRLIRRDEFPRQIGELLLGATETGPSGRQPLGLGLRAWLVRALQLGSQDSYATVGQALKGLEQILTGADGYVADSAAVFAMLAPAAPEARPSPAPAPAPAPARAAGSGPHAPAMPAKDSGPRVAAEFPQPAVAADRHPVAVPAAPALRSDAPRVTVAVASPFPAMAEASAGAPAASPEASETSAATASYESLSTPAGVNCLAADVSMPAVAAMPKSGGHRTVQAPATHPSVDSSRFGDDETPVARTSQAYSPTLFGADDSDTPVSQASPQRSWLLMGAAAAGLILIAAGIPSLWLLTRPAAPKAPVSAQAAEAQPGAREPSADRTAPATPAAGTPNANARGAAPVVPKAGLPPATAPRGDAAGVGIGAAARPPAPAPAPPPAAPDGLLAVTAPLPMQILEKGAVLGSSPGPAISLAPGRHDIEIVNESVAYRDVRSIEVASGKTVSLVIAVPPGTMSINALPWAEVWVDGQKVGETPVANIVVPLGPHEVVFRHPQFGERRQTVVVTTTAPLRVSVDLRKQ